MTGVASVQIEALALAASAIAGRANARDVAVLRGLAAAALPEQDPLRQAIEDFARRRPGAARDPRRMMVLGKRLGDAVAASRRDRRPGHV